MDWLDEKSEINIARAGVREHERLNQELREELDSMKKVDSYQKKGYDLSENIEYILEVKEYE